MMKELRSAVYDGIVIHKRHKPKQHFLKYRVFSLLLDLDEMASFASGSFIFGYNRPAIMSFYDKDHGPGRNRPLRPWIEKQLSEAGLDLKGGPIRLLCYPRLFGYVFNPLSVYFCYDREEELGSLDLPVLFTAGRFDEATPESVEHYRSLTPNSEIAIFESSAHMTMLDEPEAYVAAIREFLNRIDAAP